MRSSEKIEFSELFSQERLLRKKAYRHSAEQVFEDERLKEKLLSRIIPHIEDLELATGDVYSEVQHEWIREAILSWQSLLHTQFLETYEACVRNRRLTAPKEECNECQYYLENEQENEIVESISALLDEKFGQYSKEIKDEVIKGQEQTKSVHNYYISSSHLGGTFDQLNDALHSPSWKLGETLDLDLKIN